jgi:Family of unknown function (DUF5719)
VVTRPSGLRGRLLSVGAVVAGLAIVYGAGSALHPATVGASAVVAQASRAPVVTATRACPAPGSPAPTSASLATVAQPGDARSGSAVVTRLTGTGNAAAGPALGTLTTPGVPVLTAVPPVKAPKGKAKTVATGNSVTTVPGRGGVMVQATGALAQGLEAEQTSPGGLVTLDCPAPGTDFWFVGPGATAAPNIELYLMNAGSEPADVQVAALTDSGPLLGSTDTGIIVPPHGMVQQALGGLLKASRVIALHIITSGGQVEAAVRESKTAHAAGGWLPAAEAPARSLVIPGVPASSGARDLYITVPGNASTQVKVTVVTAKGSYQPTGGSGIDLPGQSAVSVQLPSLSAVAGAVKITATVPVTAAIMVPGGAAGAPGALTAAAGPVTEQALAADNPIGVAGSSDLVISAPAGKASVRVVTATAKSGFGSQTGTVETIPAGHSVLIRVKPPPGRAKDFSVLVTPLPGSGPVYVGRLTRSDGQVRSIMPLTSALTWAALPPVRDSARAVSAGN